MDSVQTEQVAVRCATTADESALVDTLVLAFASDPMARWAWCDPREYLAAMPAFARAFGGGAFANGGAHCTSDRVAAALWLPPGIHPDEETMVRIVEETVAETVRDDLLVILEQMDQHHPAEPHWYLPLIGVDPAHQGRGHGTSLLSFALQLCDHHGVPAYLEATTQRNFALYERFGFVPLGRIQQGTSPPLIPMLRAPR